MADFNKAIVKTLSKEGGSRFTDDPHDRGGEAASSSLFIAGWRPAIGWIGAFALLYQFILYPLLLWLPVKEPPKPLDYTMLFTLITGMLGIAGLRSFDKLKGTDTTKIGE